MSKNEISIIPPLDLGGIKLKDGDEEIITTAPLEFSLSPRSSFPAKPSINESPRSILLATQRIRAYSTPSKFVSLNRSRNSSLTPPLSPPTAITYTKSPENRHRARTEGSTLPTPIDGDFFCPDSPLGSPLIRKRTEKKDKDDFILNEKLDDTDDAISIPYNFKHLKHVDKENKRIVDEQFILEKIPNGKEGWLGKKSGKSNKTFWAVVYMGELKLYKTNTKDKLKYSLILYQCKLICKQQTPLELSLESTNGKDVITLIGSEVKEMDEWKSVLLDDGAISNEISELQRIRMERSIMKEKHTKKQQEDDYVRSEKLRRSEGKRSSINVNHPFQDNELLVMSWSITSELFYINDNSNNKKKQSFRIKVSIGQFEWNIIRETSNIIKYYKKLIELLPNLKGSIYDNSNNSSNSSLKNNELLVENIDIFLRLLVNNREIVMRDKIHRKSFLKFILPLYWQDEKPNDFVLPFII
ncbi:hypothetical protein PPL_10336 [Heterostelium album PN500]|uniref:CRIB domain-containing protein n=1 Tax=Heterostelium pallidum (strain ATCC 26659 / Pp 5 / PN500) TaxID=670386 RepID=D3BQ16_HETP5|nr:hypothetical protein PPL_10336 [Heterostelium album PN500]EFA76567.1 hypothetical protein PPL_10336 [Heterostelium album PN500]|eukprot:XP_020428699.1 hypothetical protein PPL_10336 [Heterostelium album PN500]